MWDVDAYIQEHYPAGEDVEIDCCECGKWTVGAPRCECGNRRIYLEVMEDAELVYPVAD